MITPIVVVAVAIAYLAFASLSSALTFVAADAWTVWLASGLVLGLLLACRREKCAAILGGAALGASIFSFLLGDLSIINAVGYAAIEVSTALAGAFVFVWLAPRRPGSKVRASWRRCSPLRWCSPFLGGALAAAWSGRRQISIRRCARSTSG